MNYRDKAKQLHENVNHTYDGYNYVLHLDAVEAVHQEFKDELDFNIEFTSNVSEAGKYTIIDKKITAACYLHDTIEDTRVTLNDLLKLTLIDEDICNIVYALTNEKGRDREERANDKYYNDIRNTPGASFVKMCDRIANVRYSKLKGSSMFDRYKKENENFMKKVDADRFPKMKQCLIDLFK